MKIYPIVCLMAMVLLSGCSKQYKAKRAIKEELRLTLHDYKSYEPVQFGKIEVGFSSWDDQPQVKTWLDKSEEWMKKHKEYYDEAEIYKDYYVKDKFFELSRLESMALDSAKFYLDKTERFKIEYTPVINGWKMTHSYRARSLGGNLGIHHYVFYLNKPLSKVIKTVDISE